MDDRKNRLSCRVRGNGSPVGKPRIYVTCHPDDAALYLESVAADLLRRVNCAVWFKTDPSDSFRDETETELLLGGMQLFVMPVTTRLLSEPNEAADREYVFAAAHCIPVLMLMEEERIDDIYWRRFGNIQYLTPNAKDPTAIGFDEKMDRFLDRILIIDDTAERVRKAFDARVFLSYRKIDREYALRLIRQIHEDRQYESVAVWYDEYLVPTEDFGEGIRKALTESDLFALLVTPNLLEPHNYVMDEEYPAARRDRKPVLPVTGRPTDRVELEKHFDAIPKCIDPGDGHALTDALREHLGDKMTTHRSPESAYLLARAYLEGIDVEVDRPRGLGLMEWAAEQGLDDAMIELCVMYDEGKGVARSKEKALEWAERLTESLREKGDIPGACDSLETAANILCEMGRLKDAEARADEMLDLAGSLSNEDSGKNRIMAEAWDLKANCAEMTGHADRADVMIIRAAELRYGDLSDARWTPETYPYLYDYFIFFARRKAKDGKYEEALEYLQIARSIAADLYKGRVITNMDLRCRMAYILLQIGIIETGRYHFDNARTKLKTALDIYSQLTAESRDVAMRRNEMLCISSLGDNEQRDHRYKAAMEQYTRALRIAEELIEKTGSVQSQSDKANIISAMAESEAMVGTVRQARRLMEKCVSDIEQVHFSTDSAGYTGEYVRSIIGLARVRALEGSMEEAEKDLERANVILRKACNKWPGTEEFDELRAFSKYLRGNFLNQEGLVSKAERVFKEGLEYIGNVKACQGDLPWIRKWEPAFLAMLGNIAMKKDRLPDAEAFLVKALDLRDSDPYAKLSETYGNLWDLYRALGDIAFFRGNYPAAAEKYKKGLEIALAVLDHSDSPAEYSAVGTMYACMGNTELAQWHTDAAMDWYIRSCDVFREVAKSDRTIGAATDLCKSCEKIGTLEYIRKNYDKAKTAFESMRNIALEIMEKSGGTAEARNLLSLADIYIGRVTNLSGEGERADEYIEEGIRLRDGLTHLRQTEVDRQALFDGYLELTVYLIGRGDTDRAEDMLERTLTLGKDMYENSVSFPSRMCLPRALVTLGSFVRDTGDDRRALEMYLDAAGLMETLLKDVDNGLLNGLMFTAYCSCADIESDMGNEELFFQYLEQAVRHAERVDQSELLPDIRVMTAAMYEEYAEWFFLRDRWEEALKYAERGRETALPLMDSEEYAITAGCVIADCDSMLAPMFSEAGKTEAGEALIREGYELCVRLKETIGDPELREDILALLDMFADYMNKE